MRFLKVTDIYVSGNKSYFFFKKGIFEIKIMIEKSQKRKKFGFLIEK